MYFLNIFWEENKQVERYDNVVLNTSLHCLSHTQSKSQTAHCQDMIN